MNETQIIRIGDALRLTGESRSAAYRKIKSGEWPQPVAIGKRAIGFVASEIYALNQKRISASRKSIQT